MTLEEQRKIWEPRPKPAAEGAEKPRCEQIRSEYREKADQLRNRFIKFENEITQDERLDTNYKQKIISEAKEKAKEEMAVLRRELDSALEDYKQSLINDAFRCSSQTLKSDYLATMTNVTGMSKSQRLEYIKNAATIGAIDHIRAAAHSAYKERDMNALELVCEVADKETSDAIVKLFDNNKYSDTQRLNDRMYMTMS